MVGCQKNIPSAIIAEDHSANLKVVNDREQRQDDSGNGKVKFSKKFKKKEKAKEAVTETFEPRAVEKPMCGCFICGDLNTERENARNAAS
ncbi:UNVERIFIED_CONTAM: hypothetical protein Sradi_5701500 [Sesamum radiatum]|uniref:Uncharacterized protein n=1 Tax=Sesamum radiatum TaxID=300843 RepID=A0AAW2L162_SESRA